MSALANNFKMKFAGLLRGMLRRVDSGEETAPEMARPVVTAAPLPAAATPPATRHAQATSTVVPPPLHSSAHVDNVAELEMPLLPIIEKLPPDLRAKWTNGGVNLAEASICISIEKVLPQLAQGVVKITFGELRNAAPNLFRMGEEYDSLPIALPLNDVLTRLNPALLARHAARKTITPPSEIAGPFVGGAQGVAFTTAPLKATPSTTHLFRKTPPPSESAKISMPTPVAPPPPFNPRPVMPAAPITAAPAQPRATTSAPVPRTPASVPQIPGQPRPPVPSPFPIPAQARPGTPAPAPQVPRPPAPSPIPMPTQIPAPFQKQTPAQAPAPAPIPFLKPITPAAATPAPAHAQGEIATISAPLRALAESWPETLRQEIVQLNLVNAQIALPVHLIEPAMRRGRVTFFWHQLRSWVRPTPPQDSSIHDNTELELPLKVIAPLFLPRQNPVAQQRVQPTTPPSSVPNLFFGFPQPQPEELASPLNVPEPEPDIVPLVKPVDARLAETNYYVWGDENESPHVDETDYKRSGPQTDFTSRQSMPQEIIDRAMKFPNVAGAIIALPDGLKVAHQLPPELNPDTVAAFLPQLFSRVSQCSKELRMGELNNLNFTIGNIPWKIFRVNAVYFAAFGRSGEPLPTSQLAGLAGELDRKK